jgi:hypothetical protein
MPCFLRKRDDRMGRGRCFLPRYCCPTWIIPPLLRRARPDPPRICITQITSSGCRRMVFFHPSAPASKLASLPGKKIPSAKLRVICCPTWIRTKTNRTKICRTTIILSGNPFLKRSAKIRADRAGSKRISTHPPICQATGPRQATAQERQPPGPRDPPITQT